MAILTLELSDEQTAALEQVAAQRGMMPADAALSALETYLADYQMITDINHDDMTPSWTPMKG